jgi:hypothetical protein
MNSKDKLKSTYVNSKGKLKSKKPVLISQEKPRREKPAEFRKYIISGKMLNIL